MTSAIKLSIIAQQHLQELYDAAGVPRDQLPYSPELAQVCRDFQDRTFKNATEAQVYAAILKYVRPGRRVAGARPAGAGAAPERLEQAARLNAQRRAGGKLQPYTPAFDGAREAFAHDGGDALSPQEFWHVVRLAGCRAAPKAHGSGAPVAVRG